MHRFRVLSAFCLVLFGAHVAVGAKPLDIGSRWELFVDEFLVASKRNVAPKLHEPVRREIVLTTDDPPAAPNPRWTRR